MIGIKAGQLEGKVGEVKATLRKFAVRKIYRMSGYQQAVERTSMKKAPGASPAGTPPHTHPRTSKKTGKNLPAFPQSIRFKVEDKGLQSRSVVGPAKPSKGRKANWAERIGKTHEFGGTARVEKRVVYQQFDTSINALPLRQLCRSSLPKKYPPPLHHTQHSLTKNAKTVGNFTRWNKLW